MICRTSDHHNHYHNLNLKGVRRCIFRGVRWCTTLSRPNAFTLMLAHTYRILPIHRREKIVIQQKVPQNPCVVHRGNFLSKYIVDSRFYYLLWFLKKICTCLNFYVDSLFKVSTILTLIKNCRGHTVGTESPFICLDSHGQFGLEALLCHSSCIYDQRCRFKVRTNAGRPGLKRQNPGILMAQVQVRAECSIVETHWTRPACEIASTVC